MSSSNLVAARRIRALLPSLTDIMVDCCDDVRTSVVVARVTKLMKEHIDILENPAAPRSLQPNSSVVGGSGNQPEVWPAVSINFAEYMRRHYPSLGAAVADTSSRKRSAPDTDVASSESDQDNDVARPQKKNRSPQLAAMERFVNGVLEGRYDGICAVDGCHNPVHKRLCCSGCKEKELRARREKNTEASKK